MLVPGSFEIRSVRMGAARRAVERQTTPVSPLPDASARVLGSIDDFLTEALVEAGTLVVDLARSPISRL
jgi:hypothetical protein